MQPSATATESGRRPRIGVDFHTFDGIHQGSRSHLLGIYREAIPLAPDLDFVFLLSEPQRLAAEHAVFRAPNVRLVRMPHRPGLLRLALQLSLHQWRERLDLLHVQYRLPFFPAGACACTIHDVLFETHPQFFGRAFVRMSRITSRLAAARARVLLTVSEYSRDAMTRLYRIPAARIGLTPNGVDRARFFPGAAQAEVVRAHGLVPGAYICTVGRLEPRKNHVALFKAFAQLPSPRPTLAVIGQRDFDHAAIFAAIDALGLGNEVRIIENAGDDALPALLRHARLFVFPSHAEGFGMPVLEAMASGVPVITSNSTSLPEVAGDAARLVDPNEVNDIAGAMAADLAMSDDERASRIARGLQRAARYTWQQAAAELVARFRALVIGAPMPEATKPPARETCSVAKPDAFVGELSPITFSHGHGTASKTNPAAVHEVAP